MLFRQLYDSESSTYTYVIADKKTKKSAIIDPVIEQVDRDLKLIKELGLELFYSIETHIHADHITGGAKIREATGCLLVIPEKTKAPCADKFISHGEQIDLGEVIIEAIATPGHTDSHMAYLVNGDRVLTGDALLIRGCGRTDFQSGDAGTLYDSIIKRLFTLPVETLIFPGHDYNGLTVSTVQEEKTLNPRVTNRSREDFINLMNNLNLSLPKKIDVAVPANKKCGFI